MNDTVSAGQMVAKCRVRSLINQELPLLKDHLLRLDTESRRDRFNGYADEGFIERYAAKCARRWNHHHGVFRRRRRGACRRRTASARSVQRLASGDRVQRRSDAAPQGRRQHPVQEADRGRAAELGYEKLRITTGSQNQAMRALANKFGAHLTFRHGESTGMIELSPSIEAPSFAPGPASEEVPAGRRQGADRFQSGVLAVVSDDVGKRQGA